MEPEHFVVVCPECGSAKSYPTWPGALSVDAVVHCPVCNAMIKYSIDADGVVASAIPVDEHPLDQLLEEYVQNGNNARARSPI